MQSGRERNESQVTVMVPQPLFKQRVVALIAEDVEHVDHATDKIHISLRRKVEKFGRPASEIEGIMAATGLSPLITCSLDAGDNRLIYAFAESFEALHVDQVVDLLVDLLEVNSQEAREETFQCHETYVRLSWLRYIYHSKCDCWIYEHFPTITSSIVAEDYHERKPRACRWKSGKALPVSTYRKRLDRLTSDVVCWIPYERVVHQFGYVQTIPPHHPAPSLPIEDIDDRWIQFFEYLALLEDPPRHPSMVHDDTFIELDPPQYPVSTVAMPEPPAAAAADVDMPRHAHEVCQAIIERLKLLINLRVVTEGTYAYTVTEECPRIASSVTMQGNVYVRSRRKWCMPDA
ncbi:hypothetical protein GmHk_18G052140 [Glycine max]|nr:hypothetical protein GmHk_18G052140 [Glycine max]